MYHHAWIILLEP